MKQQILTVERISKLGRLGETLAEEQLNANGFSNVKNLNESINYPFADLVAELKGVRFLISVKTRNEFQANGKLNPCFNAVNPNQAVLRALKAEGKTEDQITAIIWEAVDHLASRWGARPAWISIPMRPEEGTYAAYFGEVAQIRHRRSIPMTAEACRRYRKLAPRGTFDHRITKGLSNRERELPQSVAGLLLDGDSAI